MPTTKKKTVQTTKKAKVPRRPQKKMPVVPKNIASQGQINPPTGTAGNTESTPCMTPSTETNVNAAKKLWRKIFG